MNPRETNYMEGGRPAFKPVICKQQSSDQAGVCRMRIELQTCKLAEVRTTNSTRQIAVPTGQSAVVPGALWPVRCPHWAKRKQHAPRPFRILQRKSAFCCDPIVFSTISTACKQTANRMYMGTSFTTARSKYDPGNKKSEDNELSRACIQFVHKLLMCQRVPIARVLAIALRPSDLMGP